MDKLIVEIKENRIKYLLIFALFLFYFIVALHKLTYSSLWYDETIEYFFSKYFFSDIPLGINEETPYVRLLSALQPPLYNFVMYFWLKIYDSEFWFRFFGVLMGAVTLLGVYKSLNRFVNYKISLAVCAFTVCLYNFIYYCQECAEYNLMLAFSAWCLFFFVKLLDKITLKDTILFALLGCLAAGTQYGSAFFVSGCAIVLFIKSLIEKDFKSTKLLSLVYFTALLFAAIPLYWFFVRLQMGREDIMSSIFNIPCNNHFTDIIKSFFISLNYLFSCHNFHLKLRFPVNFILTQMIMTFLFVFVLFYNLFKSKEKNFRYLNLSFIVVWLIYYLFAKAGFYAYGKFANRYELFLYPIFIVVFGVSLFSFIKRIWESKNKFIKTVVICLCSVLFLNLCVNELKYIEKNWMKDNYRGLVNYWYSNECYNKPSIIYYELRQGFGYYFLHDKRYKKEYENSFIVQPWSRGAEFADYQKFFEESFKGEYPDSFYFCIGHNYNKDAVLIALAFMSFGYETKEVYFSKDVQILLLNKADKQE